MRQRILTRRPVRSGIVVALAAALAAGVAASPSLGGRLARSLGFATASAPGPGTLETLGLHGEVPDFALVERSGSRVTRADLLGAVWVANFVYTRCTETCPLQTARLARVQTETEFAGDAALRVVSITVDPDRDTPAALTAYAEKYGADPARWLFLTGDKRAIYRLAKDGFRLGVVDPDDPQASAGLLKPAPAFAAHGSTGLIMHSTRLVLVDRQAHIRAYHLPDDEASLARLRENLRALLREGPKSG